MTEALRPQLDTVRRSSGSRSCGGPRESASLVGGVKRFASARRSCIRFAACAAAHTLPSVMPFLPSCSKAVAWRQAFSSAV